MGSQVSPRAAPDRRWPPPGRLRGRVRLSAVGTSALALLAVLGGVAGSARLADAVPRPPPPPPTKIPVPTLDDWFSGANADFRLKTRLTAATMPGADAQFGKGAHLTASPDDPSTWYVFGRRAVAVQPVPACDAMPTAFGIDIWKSTDGGVTWSVPANLVSPAEGTPWACFAGDGDAYFDAGTQTWHYLAQCRGRDNLWNGCHWTRASRDPMGDWQADPANPVVSTAQGSTTNLWQRICGPSTNCFGDSRTADPQPPDGPKATVSDAGTFTIFDVAGDPGFHYVRFHGAAANGHQYTGLAKTPDFVNWVVGPDDPAHLPSDDIFDSRFPKGLPAGDGHGGAPAWREPHWLAPNSSDAVIGGGGGHIMEEGPWYYLVAEASDRPLCAMPGATWDLGIYRTASLASTVWDSPAHPHENPVAFSDDSVAGSPVPSSCDPSYPRLLRDAATGETDLVYNRVIRMSGGPDAPPDPTRSGLYVYTLRWNLLQQARPGDDGPALAPSAPWRVISAAADPPPPSALAARRDAYRAPDANGYLVFNCDGGDAPCGPSKAIYQDSYVGHGLRPAAARFVFGGKAAAADGQDGQVRFLVGQLDASGRWLATDAVAATITANGYTAATSGPVVLRRGTVWLRYMVWVNGERSTVEAGELFVEPSP